MNGVDQQILGSLFATLKTEHQWKSIVSLFDAGYKTRLSIIENASNDGVLSDAKPAAHALKGSCYMFGARNCAQKCERLEGLIASGDVVAVQALVAEIKSDVQEFRRYLDLELIDRHLLT